MFCALVHFSYCVFRINSDSRKNFILTRDGFCCKRAAVR
jgi:hypothetical protein